MAQAQVKSRENNAELMTEAIGDLKRYYGGSGIEKSPEFARLVSWMTANKDELSARLEKAKKGGTVPDNDSQLVFGMWLGGQYLAANECGKEPKMPPIVMGKRSGWSPFGKFISVSELVSKNEARAFGSGAGALVAGFNEGIHEHTHALLHILGGEGELSELATFIATDRYALPVKNRENSWMIAFGKRNILHSIRERERRRESTNIVLTDYLAHAIGPWMMGYYGNRGKGLNLADFKSEFSWEARKEDETLGSLYAGSAKGLLKSKTEEINSMTKEFAIAGPFSKEAFFATEGIKDRVLMEKLGRVFDALLTGKYDNGAGFVDAFVREMDREFGTAADSGIPRDFVYNSVPKRVRPA